MYKEQDAEGEELSFNRTFMELKSACAASRPPRHPCFNRTFMELKLGTVVNIRNKRRVLIVPLWN